MKLNTDRVRAVARAISASIYGVDCTNWRNWIDQFAPPSEADARELARIERGLAIDHAYAALAALDALDGGQEDAPYAICAGCGERVRTDTTTGRHRCAIDGGQE